MFCTTHPTSYSPKCATYKNKWSAHLIQQHQQCATSKTWMTCTTHPATNISYSRSKMNCTINLAFTFTKSIIHVPINFILLHQKEYRQCREAVSKELRLWYHIVGKTSLWAAVEAMKKNYKTQKYLQRIKPTNYRTL